MKNLEPMSAAERQQKFRENLSQKNGARLSITISQEAANALQVIQCGLQRQKKPHTKRAAIETALIDLAKLWNIG